MSRRRVVVALLASVAFSSCSGDAAVLDHAGEGARRAGAAWTLVAVVAIGVVAIVTVAIAWALFARRGRATPRWSDGVVAIGGFVVPAVVVIVAAVIAATTVTGSATEAAAVRIRIEAHQWWWGVEYLDSGIESANEIVLPVGVPVSLEITSDNVVHSLWFPQLSPRLDVIPGRVAEMTLEVDRPGVFVGRCAEYCGLQHAHMDLRAIAKEPSDYQAWVADERAALAERGQGVMPAGLGVFIAVGCDRCHTIGGTVADGLVGPDLTHVGSRLTIGAGALPNTDGDLARWIADPWSVKPGAKMPGFADELTPYQLGTLVEYLESLR